MTYKQWKIWDDGEPFFFKIEYDTRDWALPLRVLFFYKAVSIGFLCFNIYIDWECDKFGQRR